jgi:phage tail tape-measure protein
LAGLATAAEGLADSEVDALANELEEAKGLATIGAAEYGVPAGDAFADELAGIDEEGLAGVLTVGADEGPDGKLADADKEGFAVALADGELVGLAAVLGDQVDDSFANWLTDADREGFVAALMDAELEGLVGVLDEGVEDGFADWLADAVLEGFADAVEDGLAVVVGKIVL